MKIPCDAATSSKRRDKVQIKLAALLAIVRERVAAKSTVRVTGTRKGATHFAIARTAPISLTNNVDLNTKSLNYNQSKIIII